MVNAINNLATGAVSPTIPVQDNQSDYDKIMSQSDFQRKFGGIADAPWYQPNGAAYQTGNEDQMLQAYAAQRQAMAGRSAPTMNASQINMGPQDQVRNAQMANLAQLQGQAQGQLVAPSQANLIAEMQRGQGNQQAMAQAAAQRGGLGINQAQQQLTQSALGVGGAAVQQRAQEQGAMEQQIAQQSGQARQQDIGLATQQAGLNQQSNIANQQSQLQQQSMNDNMTAFYEQQGFNLEEARAKAAQEFERVKAEQVMAQTNAAAGMYSAEQQAQAQSDAAKWGLVSTAISVGAFAAFSDKHLKKNIKKETTDLDDFMNGLKSYSYVYKNPQHGEDKRFGIMAQDMEKSNIGKSAVINTAEGKMIDLNKSVSVSLAGLARLNERLNKIEDK